jgi:hypothetical protein
MQRRKRDSKSKYQPSVSSHTNSSQQSPEPKKSKKWVGKIILAIVAFGLGWIVYITVQPWLENLSEDQKTQPSITAGIPKTSTAESQQTSREATKSAESGPSNQILQVEVLNGCGAPGVGSKFTEFLRSRGYDVVKTDNADNWNYPNTVVIDRRGDIHKAGVLAETLGAKKVIQQIETTRLLDLSVIIGKDFKKLKVYESK